MKKFLIASFCVVLMVSCFAGCSSDSDVSAIENTTPVYSTEYEFFQALGNSAAEKAIEMLENESQARSASQDLDLIALTNAGYAAIDGKTTQASLDGLAEKTDTSFGKETLFEVHAAADANLWFFIYDKDSGNGVYCEADASQFTSTTSLPDDPFSIVTLYNIKADDDNLYANLPQANEDLFVNKGFGGNEFRIISLANLAANGAPYDMMKSALYHDHFCPGVTSGYFLAKYVQKNFPLTETYSNYFVLSVPPWCKDDALMTLLNATPGKKGYGVFYLNDDEISNLKDDTKNIAGIFFRWNGDVSNPDVEGLVLGFDWGTSKEDNHWNDDNDWTWWEARFRMDLYFLSYLNNLDTFVKEIKTFNLNNYLPNGQPSDLVHPGSNPLEVLDLVNP
ncbi:Formylmethanofuran dehydrogenase subunit E domain-containing protein [Candidatus Magnetomoraceae bacterium gMMP-1]